MIYRLIESVSVDYYLNPSVPHHPPPTCRNINLGSEKPPARLNRCDDPQNTKQSLFHYLLSLSDACQFSLSWEREISLSLIVWLQNTFGGQFVHYSYETEPTHNNRTTLFTIHINSVDNNILLLMMKSRPGQAGADVEVDVLLAFCGALLFVHWK